MHCVCFCDIVHHIVSTLTEPDLKSWMAWRASENTVCKERSMTWRFFLALGCAIAMHCIALYCNPLNCIALHYILKNTKTKRSPILFYCFFYDFFFTNFQKRHFFFDLNAPAYLSRKMGLVGMASGNDIAFSLVLSCAISLHCITMHCICKERSIQSVFMYCMA